MTLLAAMGTGRFATSSPSKEWVGKLCFRKRNCKPAPLKMDYKVARIPKGKSRFREIYIPTPTRKRRLRSLIPFLEEVARNQDKCGVNYAFEKGKNCALNAFQHIGYRYSLSFDLMDFFDSVKLAHVEKILPRFVIDECFVNGSPRQGFPTSPLIATIAFYACDLKIVGYLHSFKINAKYTRYADDLVFSFDEIKDAGKLSTIVRQVVGEGGFRINEKKTRLQDSKNGRIIINGIAIDSNGIFATRKTQKKIRAALHQGNLQSAAGLVEWAKCKLPSLESGLNYG